MIEIVTTLVRDKRGHVLLVRKRGTESYMQPGGKRPTRPARARPRPASCLVAR